MKNFLKNLFTDGQPWVSIITYAIILGFLLFNLSPIFTGIGYFMGYLKPFFYGIVIAFVLNIPMKQCENFLKKHMKPAGRMYKSIRGLSITYAFVLMFAIIILFGYLIIPPLFSSISLFITNIVNVVNGVINNTDQIFTWLHLDPIDIQIDNTSIQNFFSSIGLDWKNIVTNITDFVSATGNSFLDNIGKFSVSIGNWFLGLMLAIYLLYSKETLIRQAKKLAAALFPYSFTKVLMRVLSRANTIFSRFISGQLVEALIIGLLEYIMMLIFRIPYSMLIACIVSVMALVPIFGATLACIIGFILVFSVNPWQAVLFVIIYQCTQQFENNVIYPKVVGKSVGLPGIWTLLSIVVFGNMFGVMGMLVAVPLTALIYSFGSELINRSLKRKNLVVTTDSVTEKAEDPKEEPKAQS